MWDEPLSQIKEKGLIQEIYEIEGFEVIVHYEYLGPVELLLKAGSVTWPEKEDYVQVRVSCKYPTEGILRAPPHYLHNLPESGFGRIFDSDTIKNAFAMARVYVISTQFPELLKFMRARKERFAKREESLRVAMVDSPFLHEDPEE